MNIKNEFLKKNCIPEDYCDHIMKVIKNDEKPKYEIHLSPMAFYKNPDDKNSSEHLILADTVTEIKKKIKPQFIHLKEVPGITSWNEIASQLIVWQNMTCKPSVNKLPSGYIENEDMSVKWNREFVEQNNHQYAEELKKLNREKNKIFHNICGNCYALIRYELNNRISFEDAQKIWNYADEKSHPYGIYDVINTLIEVMELIKSLSLFSDEKNKNLQ